MRIYLPKSYVESLFRELKSSYSINSCYIESSSRRLAEFHHSPPGHVLFEFYCGDFLDKVLSKYLVWRARSSIASRQAARKVRNDNSN